MAEMIDERIHGIGSVTRDIWIWQIWLIWQIWQIWQI
jgi:hypothetical protein